MMRTGRVEAFSDGVIAVAITLLVLNLRTPATSGSLIAALADEWSAFVAVFISFLGIGIVWVSHHAFFHTVSTRDAHPVALPLCAPGTAPSLPLLVVAGRFLPDGSLAALTCPRPAGGAATVSAYDPLGSAARRPLIAALPFPNTVGRLNAVALSPDGQAILGVTTPTPSDIRSKRGSVWRWSGGDPVRLPLLAASVAW